MTRSLLLLLAILGIAYFLWMAREGRGLKAGEAAPGFVLQTRDGTEVSLENLKGKTVLLNFWATWCPPCVMEMPSLSRLQTLLKPRGLEVVAISLDGSWQEVEAFSTKHPLSMNVLLDAQGEVAGRYGALRLPITFLIDRNGKIAKTYLGPREWTEPGLVKEILNHVESP